jgi:predicted dinucleotide-binding enzyme
MRHDSRGQPHIHHHSIPDRMHFVPLRFPTISALRTILLHGETNMRIGVLGTGVVGQTIGGGLIRIGHEVKLGARSATNEKGAKWVAALGAAGAANLNGKTLVDVANPLDFSKGMPPSLTVCNTDSLAEQIQTAFPGARVVKALNTMTATVMVQPSLVAGEHDVFMCGTDASAKAQIAELLGALGWKNIIDLGDLTAARGMEMILPLWLRLYGTLKTPTFNFHIARG